MLDLCSLIKCSRGISPAVKTTDNTAYVSQILDVLDYRSATFLILLGTETDANATFTVLVEHGDSPTLSDAVAVADEDLIGVEAMGLQFDSDNKVAKIGYKGGSGKRYLRVTITPANNDAGDIYLAGVWVQGHPTKPGALSQVV